MSFAVLKTGVLTFRWQSVFTSVSLANEVFFPPGRHPAKREGRKGKKEGRKTEKRVKKTSCQILNVSYTHFLLNRVYTAGLPDSSIFLFFNPLARSLSVSLVGFSFVTLCRAMQPRG